jgi:hypothetical protein
LFVSQGRGREVLLSTSLVSALSVLSVIIGLPFGPVGVAFASSAVGLFMVVPVLYYMAGREGPVTTADLWFGLLRYVPLWAVVSGVTFLMLMLSRQFRPIVQLTICAPVGLLAGATMIYASRLSSANGFEPCRYLPAVERMITRLDTSHRKNSMPAHREWHRLFFYRREGLRTTWKFRLATLAISLLVPFLTRSLWVPAIANSLTCREQVCGR